MRIGSMCVSYDLFDVNFDHLRRKRAFVKGVDIRIREEMDKEKLMGFANLPDIVPIKPKNQTLSNVDYVELMKASEEESKEEGTPGQSGLFDYDTENEAAKSELLDRFELIRKRQIKMGPENGKPLAIIYNPYTSGDRVEEIVNALDEKYCMNEVIMCESNIDPFRKAQELELDTYSALIAVGGDGTFNQMVNGMLSRPDGKQIPVGLIPTGQSNDAARSLGLPLDNIQHAIDTIVHGETISVDTTRVLLDADSERSLPAGEERLANCRYMISNSSLSMPTKISSGANTWKGCCSGSSSFSMSTYLQAFSCGFVADTYTLTIDDQPLADGRFDTALMMVTNGKYANGGMVMNPFACINDGLIDITWIADPSYSGTFGVTGVLADARNNGI